MSFFDEFIVRPILNLLMAIYSLIPDFGVSVIIFTIIVRLLLWPLIKKQLHQAKAMRKMQPELVKIKKQYAKNPQMRNLAMVELYKKHRKPAVISIRILHIFYRGYRRTNRLSIFIDKLKTAMTVKPITLL